MPIIIIPGVLVGLLLGSNKLKSVNKIIIATVFILLCLIDYLLEFFLKTPEFLIVTRIGISLFGILALGWLVYSYFKKS